MASPTEENYLKSLLMLTNQKAKVTITGLSNSLGVSLPTVNNMVKKLKKKELINYERYKPISLTAKGEKAASLVFRKHRLSEMFLTEKMGFGWEEVHDIAEQLEHINSKRFFDRMDELLGFPKFDPHGSPIPDKNGKIFQEPFVLLSNCQAGDDVSLVSLSNDSSDFLQFLNNRELHLGTKLKIKFVEPYDRSMTLSYKNHSYETFSKIICDCLFVRYLDE